MTRTLRLKNRRSWSVMAASGLVVILITPASAQGNRLSNRNDGDQAGRSARYDRTGLPSGTVIPVRLDEPLSSKSASRGDKFSSTLVHGEDDAGLPEGTRIEGVVQEAVASEDGHPGSLDVDFRRIVFPDSSFQSINASLYSLSGKVVKRADGRLVATGNKSKDRLKFIGIGAGAGLLIGSLTKNNSILSVLLGAGAGYLYNEFGNKPKPGDVNLKQGQEFGVHFDRRLNFNTQTRRYYNQHHGMQAAIGGNYSSPLDQIGVRVNDRVLRFDRSHQPYIRDGVVLVPLASIGNEAHFDYRYDSENGMIYAHNDEVRMERGSNVATFRGQRHNLRKAAEIRHGVAFVPLQFISWATGGSVGWDESNGTVNVTTSH